MIIASNLVPSKFTAITIWPFILVRPTSRNDLGLIAHEMVHYNEQRNCGVLPWLIMYACSKNFRLRSEIRGYQAQIAMHGISVDQAANYLMNYNLPITQEQAVKMLDPK